MRADSAPLHQPLQRDSMKIRGAARHAWKSEVNVKRRRSRLMRWPARGRPALMSLLRGMHRTSAGSTTARCGPERRTGVVTSRRSVTGLNRPALQTLAEHRVSDSLLQWPRTMQQEERQTHLLPVQKVTRQHRSIVFFKSHLPSPWFSFKRKAAWRAIRQEDGPSAVHVLRASGPCSRDPPSC